MLGAQKLGQWNFQAGGSTAPPADGLPGLTAQGTATTRIITITGDVLTQSRRIGYVSAAVIDSVAGVRSAAVQVANAPTVAGAGRYGGGGWTLFMQAAISDPALNPEARMFMGMQDVVTAAVAVDPATLTSVLGFGCDNGDTTLHFYSNDAAGLATDTDLGASFPVTPLAGGSGRDLFWRMMISCAAGQPAGAIVYNWAIERVQTGHLASGTVIANGPTQLAMAPRLWRATGPVNAAAVALDVGILRLGSQL